MILKNLKDAIQGKASLGTTRSNHWPTVRKHFLQVEGNNKCAACGSVKKLEVHHVAPFHLHPELELDPNNLITLCESKDVNNIICHLHYGHDDNYKNINPNVVKDAAVSLQLITEATKKLTS